MKKKNNKEFSDIAWIKDHLNDAFAKIEAENIRVDTVLIPPKYLDILKRAFPYLNIHDGGDIWGAEIKVSEIFAVEGGGYQDKARMRVAVTYKNTLRTIWMVEDNLITLFLEVSPKNSKCSKCQKTVKKGTPRYRALTHSGYWSLVDIYHKKCMPADIKRFIKGYPKRDFVQESLEDATDKIKDLLEGLIKTVKEVEIRKVMQKTIRKLDGKN